MYKPPLESHDISQHAEIEDQVLPKANKLKYLGATIANNRLHAELDTQMGWGSESGSTKISP